MKEIHLSNRHPSMYHTRKDSNISHRQRELGGVPQFDPKGKPQMERLGQSVITGHHIGDIGIGDQLIFHKSDVHTITNVIERRNHAGTFSDPKMKENSFYKVETTFVSF